MQWRGSHDDVELAAIRPLDDCLLLDHRQEIVSLALGHVEFFHLQLDVVLLGLLGQAICQTP